MIARVFVALLLLSVAGCGPKLESISGGPHNPNSVEFSVLYVPAYGNTERDAYLLAAQRCGSRKATRLYHEYLTIIPMDGNRIGYRCE